MNDEPVAVNRQRYFLDQVLEKFVEIDDRVSRTGEGELVVHPNPDDLRRLPLKVSDDYWTSDPQQLVAAARLAWNIQSDTLGVARLFTIYLDETLAGITSTTELVVLEATGLVAKPI